MPTDQNDNQQIRLYSITERRGQPGPTTKSLCADCGRSPAFRNMEIMFGKHKGKEIYTLPIDYLRWLYYECTLIKDDEATLEEISDTLSMRDPEWPF